MSRKKRLALVRAARGVKTNVGDPNHVGMTGGKKGKGKKGGKRT